MKPCDVCKRELRGVTNLSGFYVCGSAACQRWVKDFAGLLSPR